MNSASTLDRFLNAQQEVYETALYEIKSGKKQTHWMWFIFPQVIGLGYSEISKRYAIENIAQAEAFLLHPVLGPRLIEISEALLALKQRDAQKIFGSPDHLKLQSCVTLFSSVNTCNQVFANILDGFFRGEPDQKTLSIIKATKE